MKELLQTHSVSFAESIKIALEADGIEAVLLDEQSASALSFAGRIRIAVARDADYERAMQIIREFEPAPGPPLPSWRWHKRGLIALGVGILAIFGSAQMLGSRYQLLVAILGGVIFFSGVGLIAIGFRADREALPAPDQSAVTRR
jgi:hypothetical protein